MLRQHVNCVFVFWLLLSYDYIKLHEKENQIQSEQEAAGLAEDFERAEVLGHKLDSIREELTQLDDSLTTLSKRIRDPQSVIQKLPRCEIELRNRYIRTLSDLRVCATFIVISS